MWNICSQLKKNVVELKNVFHDMEQSHIYQHGWCNNFNYDINIISCGGNDDLSNLWDSLKKI